MSYEELYYSRIYATCLCSKLSPHLRAASCDDTIAQSTCLRTRYTFA